MASVWINKRYVNCDATIRRKRKTIRFHITPELKRNHQWIRDLFNEMEKAAKTNTKLSDQSVASLRRIKQPVHAQISFTAIGQDANDELF